MSTSLPLLSLSLLSDDRFFLRTTGPRPSVLLNPHREDYYMFGVVLSGEQSLTVDTDKLTVESGQAVIVAPGQVHAPLGEPAEDGFIIGFSPESMTDTETGLIENYSVQPFPIILDGRDVDSVRSLLQVLLQRADFHSDTEYLIASAIKGIVLRNVVSHTSASPDRYLRLVIELRALLKSNIAREKSPTVYASMLNVSRSYLNEAVNNITGLSLSKFIISYAIRIASRELVYTNHSADEIAYGIGYEDYTYFSRLFRRYTGMSPRAFRNKYRK